MKIKIKLFIVYFVMLTGASLAKALSEEQIYHQQVQPVFEARCIACHSCFNAPCQLNLQTFEGFERGGAKKNVYDGLRLNSVQPSRMFIDARSTEEWRSKGFHSVNNSDVPQQNIFLEHINIRRQFPKHSMLRSIESAMICADKVDQTKILGIRNPDLGMPYGFPPLNDKEYAAIEDWIKKGAPGPQKYAQPADEIKVQIEKWHEFLNAKSLKIKLTSRYLFEHLFLAHIYFPQDKNQFFRLVRSSKECRKEIVEIPTRRPNDDPSVENFYYCLKPTHGPVVMKTHMPFEFSDSKMERWRELFHKAEWDVKTLPSYKPEVAQNPFVTFAAIPAMSRYRFLLEDSQYHVMTFIKGPVCNGTNAVNSIQEQFYAFFLNPESDPMKDPTFEGKGMELLMLPGAFGSDVDPVSAPKLMGEMTDHREKYRKLRAQWLKTQRPQGLGLNDIWDGEKSNPNAILTIFRHDDNAVVMKGPAGHLPKTVFVLDYSLFERLVYNLVVNFDVFGNVGHQLLTRVYMDYIRMEAEENFLLFLPPEKRQVYRNAWYQGVLTEAKMNYVFPPVAKGEPTAVKYKSMEKTKTQLVEQLISYMSPAVRGLGDSLNWRQLNPPGVEMAPLNSVEKELQKIASIRSMGNLPFARYMPETSYLIVRRGGQIQDVYSIIHNREFLNISWILGEAIRRAPHEDTLTLKKGFWISYPIMIYDVEEAKIPEFVKQVRGISNIFDYPKFVKNYGVLADQDRFWKVWDDIHSYMKKTEGVNFGHLDLTRYQR